MARGRKKKILPEDPNNSSEQLDPVLDDIENLDDDVETPKFVPHSFHDVQQEARLKQALEYDIFDYCEKRSKKGDQIQYEIRKDGVLHAHKYHPYTWEKLQKDYGRGQYQVKARSLLTKGYIKSETRLVGESLRDDDEEIKFDKEAAKQAPNQNNLDFMQLLALMNSVSERSRAEAQETARAQAEANTALLQALIQKPQEGMGTKELMVFMSTMMQANKKDDTPMMELMFKMMSTSQDTANRVSEQTSRMIEKMNENNARMFEKMNERFEKIMEDSKKDDGGDKLGYLEVMQMTESAQRKGFDLFSKMQELAESKADEKLELINALKGSGTKEEKKSMTETLIETLLPSITTAVAQSTGKAPAPLNPQPRRSLPPHVSRPQASGFRGGAGKAQNAASFEGKSRGLQAQGEASRKISESGDKGVLKTHGGLPSFEVTAPQNSEQNPVVREAQVVQKPEVQVSGLRAHIEQLLTMVIGNSLLKGHSPEQGGEAILLELYRHKISVQNFLQAIDESYIMEIIEKFSLPAEVKPWFEGAYAHIQNKAGNANRSKPAEH